MTGRFPLLAQPPAAPACCVACSRGTDPQGFFDTGRELDFWGRIYLCATCLTEMARALGLDDAVVRALRAKLTEAELTCAAADAALRPALEENVRLRELVGAKVMQLLHEVTLTRLHREMDEVGAGGDDDGAGDDGGVPAGGGDGLVVRPLQPRRRRGPRTLNGSAPGPDDGGFGGGPGPAA